MFVLKNTGEFKIVDSDGKIINSGTVDLSNLTINHDEVSTTEFKVDDKVLILGESIGGFNFNGEVGKVVQVLTHNHYQVYIKEVTLTYWGTKLKLIK